MFLLVLFINQYGGCRRKDRFSYHHGTIVISEGISEFTQNNEIQAAKIMAIIEKVASFSPYSIAALVPEPCAPIPSAKPLAIGDFIENHLII